MKLKGAYIYTEDTLYGGTKSYPSLKQACLALSKVPNDKRDYMLLCIGSRNLDYMKVNETFEDYYQRMLDMVAKI